MPSLAGEGAPPAEGEDTPGPTGGAEHLGGVTQTRGCLDSNCPSAHTLGSEAEHAA